MGRTCEECQQPIVRRLNEERGRWMRRRFCSRACVYADQRPKDSKVCGGCGATFYKADLDGIIGRAWRERQFCSQACRRAERFKKVCPTCRRDFETPSYVNADHCSRECRLAPIRRLDGPRPPRRPHDVANRLAVWRRAVKKRDGHQCVLCGSSERLEADHILPQWKYPELRYDVENGRTLCRPCHSKTPSFSRRAA